MSRLPTPGSDNGTWGDILNDFLSQSHGADGSIKSGIISDTHIALSANISQSKIANLTNSYVAVYQGAFDGSDETASLQAAVTDSAGGTIIIPRGKTVRSQRITVPAPGIQVLLEAGAVLDYIDPGVNNITCLFRVEDCDFFELEGGTIQASNATGRTSSHGLIRAKNVGYLRVQHTKIGKSSATGIHTINVGAFLIDDIDIDGTYADGIHLSRATSHGTVSRIRGKNTGDDLIGLNSYTTLGSDSYAQMEDITVFDIKGINIGNGTQAGRAVAVNGVKDCFVDTVYFNGTSQAGVLVSRDGGMYDPVNVHISNVISHNPGLNPPVGGTSSAIYIAHCSGGSVHNITGSSTTISIAGTASNIQKDIVEVGRLFLRPSAFNTNGTGTPVIDGSSPGRIAHWLFDQSVDEAVSCIVDCQSELTGWKTVNIKFVWANAGTNSGDVVWRLYTSSFAPGDLEPSPTTTAGVAVTAGAQWTTISTTMVSDFTVPTDLLLVRAYRVATAGSDTLANDAGLLGVLIEKAS